MDLLVMLLAVALFPVACLGFVLWMARLEEAIPDAVRRATRTPDPPPVLAIAVRTPTVAVAIPEQRRDSPALEPQPLAAPPARPAASPAVPALEPPPLAAPAVVPAAPPARPAAPAPTGT